jgi:hypothetical protein
LEGLKTGDNVGRATEVSEGQLDTTTNPEGGHCEGKKMSPELEWCFGLAMMPALNWFEFLPLAFEILGNGLPVPPETPRNPQRIAAMRW